MNHDSSFQISPRFVQLVSVSLLLAACSGEFDRFGPAPSAAGGMAGWVLNGEGGETATLGGSGGRRPGTGGAGVDSRAGSAGSAGAVGGAAGSQSGAAASGGS